MSLAVSCKDQRRLSLYHIGEENYCFENVAIKEEMTSDSQGQKKQKK